MQISIPAASMSAPIGGLRFDNFNSIFSIWFLDKNYR
jgi:hypothetical protein